MTPEQWLAAGQMCTLAGHRIFVRDSDADGHADSSREVVLLIHGFPTASWDWHPLWAGLQQHYRLVGADMLGFGFSAKPRKHRYSIGEQADIFEALMRERGIRRCHVLAHDYGDTVAQELLAREHLRECWLSACLLNGGLFPETHRARLVQKLLASPLGPLVNGLLGEGAFRRSFSAVFGADTQPDDEELAHFWALINYNDGRHVFHNLISYMAERRQHRERWLQALAQAPCPIGLINGLSDPVSGAHMVARFRELLGDGHFVHELPGVGHYPQVEAPAQVYQGYLAFMQSLA